MEGTVLSASLLQENNDNAPHRAAPVNILKDFNLGRFNLRYWRAEVKVFTHCYILQINYNVMLIMV